MSFQMYLSVNRKHHADPLPPYTSTMRTGCLRYTDCEAAGKVKVSFT